MSLPAPPAAPPDAKLANCAGDSAGAASAPASTGLASAIAAAHSSAILSWPSAGAAGAGVIYGASPGIEDAATVEAQTGLPPLSVDLHIFADDPAKRAVFINGRRYTQGATIAEGPTVEQITREGAVLGYRGRRFLLPRL